MNVHAEAAGPQHPVHGLAHPQHVSGRLQWRKIGRLVLDVAGDDQHVQDRLGDRAGHRSRPDVLNSPCPGTEGGYEAVLLRLEARRPAGVVGDQDDRTALRAADQEGVLDGLLIIRHVPHRAPCPKALSTFGRRNHEG